MFTKIMFNMLISSAFSMNIPELPIQVVAVTDAPATNFHLTQELNQVLVAEVRIIIIIVVIVINVIKIIIIIIITTTTRGTTWRTS